MKENKLEILVHKQITGCISEEEQRVLDVLTSSDQEGTASTIKAWEAAEHYTPSVSFSADTGFMALMSRIEADQADTSNQVDDTAQAVDLVQIVEPVIEIAQPTAKVVSLFSYRSFSRVAAVLVLGLLSYISYNQFTYQTITAGDSPRYASLDDGTSVWLAPHSSLKSKRSFTSDRAVTLEGKAFFDVFRDESHPFVISSDDLEVTVLGTSFTVNTKSDIVAVNSGKVKVASQQSEATITADQKLTLSNGSLALSEVTDSEFDWIVPILSFDNTPLDQVIKELALHFDADLKYQGRADLTKCPFTATNLEGASLQQVVSILQATYDMEVSTDQETQAITFSKVRCR